MSDVKIITNNARRKIIEAYELSEKERKEFDYINWDAVDTGSESGSFVRYFGRLYDLNDLETDSSGIFPGWDAFLSETFFSGILIRMVWDENDHEYYVICGRYYS